jgi:hypothetical protein
MDNHEEEIEMLHGCVPIYERPAIIITERVGNAYVITEFSTKEDYGYYKSLED